jgi:hypothetical protein
MKKISISIISLSLIGTLFTGCTKKCDMPATVKVNAGTDQFVILPTDSVTLTGTVVNGSTANTTYLWSVISGPSVPTFGSGTSAVTYATNLVQGTYVLQFQATNNAGSIGLDTTTITVDTGKIIIIQPTSTTGQDAEVVYVPGVYDGNGTYGTDSALRISEWTYLGTPGTTRSFVKFMALNTLPAGAVITSAKLSLYGMDSAQFAYYGTAEGDNYYPGSPYPLSNELWLQRATADWDQTTITYNNQPAVTTVDEVAVPASTSQYSSNVINLDVTQLIQDMVATPGTNFGFCIRLQNEGYYRSVGFNSSEASTNNGPKLVVTYQ